MKKIIAIAAFVAISLVSVSAMAQQPVGPRNITVTNTPDGGYHVTRFGDELMPGWLVLIYNPDTRRHDVAVVSEGDCGDCMCVQIRRTRSAGDKPAKVRARSLVAWMAGRRETEFLKPIDNVIFGMTASHRAAAKANAQGASKTINSRGRACMQWAKAV